MLNRDKHRHILFSVLKDIFVSDIGKYLAFKGGTACYFLHHLDRFSTDLDFDMIEFYENIDEKIIQILSKYGTVKKGRKIILSFGEDFVNIKVDINRHIWKANIYELVDFYGTTIRVQDKSTIFANKLVALTERNTNRDIYDVYFLFQNLFEINEAVIIERTGEGVNQLYKRIIDKLESFPKNYKILDGLGEILSEKQKVFVKKSLVDELIKVIQMKQDFSE